jgi:uracil-DNA glycosylase
MSGESREEALTTLRQKLAECRLCLEAGYEIFPRAIYSGTVHAHMMVIGQAPGITEKEAGRPFNAGSGTRLFQWLADAGIEENWFRQTQYMTSITKCYPGRARSGNGDRVPSRQEQELCRQHLDAEISLVNPLVIIPVGRLSINKFFPKGLALDEIIGTEKQLDGRWIIPLPHPSGASRWHQTEANRQKISQAVEHIHRRYIQIFEA